MNKKMKMRSGQLKSMVKSMKMELRNHTVIRFVVVGKQKDAVG